ncbi:hypothetical protein [Micromonospora sp. NPDC005299]
MTDTDCRHPPAIGALHAAGITNIAAADRHHARDTIRPLALT